MYIDVNNYDDFVKLARLRGAQNGIFYRLSENAPLHLYAFGEGIVVHGQLNTMPTETQILTDFPAAQPLNEQPGLN